MLASLHSVSRRATQFQRNFNVSAVNLRSGGRQVVVCNIPARFSKDVKPTGKARVEMRKEVLQSIANQFSAYGTVVSGECARPDSRFAHFVLSTEEEASRIVKTFSSTPLQIEPQLTGNLLYDQDSSRMVVEAGFDKQVDLPPSKTVSVLGYWGTKEQFEQWLEPYKKSIISCHWSSPTDHDHRKSIRINDNKSAVIKIQLKDAGKGSELVQYIRQKIEEAGLEGVVKFWQPKAPTSPSPSSSL